MIAKLSLWLCLPLYVKCGFESLFDHIDFEAVGNMAGVTVADIDLDGHFEFLIAVSDGPNLAITYDFKEKKYVNIARKDSPFEEFRDENGRTMTICACDVDGNGVEEIYLKNSNPVYGNNDVYPDRLLTWRDEAYVDVFQDVHNVWLKQRYGGYSAACVDIDGSGNYSIVLSTFDREGRGILVLLGMDRSSRSHDVRNGIIVLNMLTDKLGVSEHIDAQGIIVGPILGNDGYSDILLTTQDSYYIGSSVLKHSGGNILLKNNRDGTFTDTSTVADIEDRDEDGRGVAIGDFNGDEMLDIAYLNWYGPNRLYIQTSNGFSNEAEGAYELPTTSGVLLTSDFNSDGQEDMFLGGASVVSLYHSTNRMFSVISSLEGNITLKERELANERLEKLVVTGISSADLDQNGVLELLVTHAETEMKTVSIFEQESGSDWLRIQPKTRTGAPARGAMVTITLFNDRRLVKVIGGGCGYRCSLEPVAHFGLAKSRARLFHVKWPDGHTVKKFLTADDVNKTLVITYSGSIENIDVAKKRLDGSTSASSDVNCLKCFQFLALFFIYMRC